MFNFTLLNVIFILRNDFERDKNGINHFKITLKHVEQIDDMVVVVFTFFLTGQEGAKEHLK